MTLIKGQSIAGRNKSDGIDYYETPSWAVEKLLDKESFNGNILEPCCGAGAISRILEAHNYEVISADIRQDADIYGISGKDFFSESYVSTSNIVTNPPYYCACEFVKRSLELANDKIAMLLKLSFLESVKRYQFFKDTPLRTIYVFSSRVTMYPGNQPKPKNGGTITYAWFVWQHGYTGKPMVDWII